MKHVDRRQRNRTMVWLMAAVAAWGGLLSLGAFLFGVDDRGAVSFAPNPTRGLIAIGCLAAFLGLWVITDQWGKRRREKTSAPRKDAASPNDSDSPPNGESAAPPN